MYKALSLDLWFTLIYEDDRMLEDIWRARVSAIHSIVKTYRDDITFEDIYRMYYEMRHILMTTHPKKIIEYIVVGLGIEREAIEKILPIYKDISISIKPHVNEEAYEALPKLKDRGVRIGLTTNTSFSEDMIWKLLKEVELDTYIDVVTTSSDLGILKPNPKIFHETVSRLGVEIGETVHVGDKYIYDAVGAYLAGMRPVLYKGLWPMYRFFRDFSRDVAEFNYPPNILVIEDLNELTKIFR